MSDELTVHIYPGDCDTAGHVNHAVMLTLLERARWAALEKHMKFEDYIRRSQFAVVRDFVQQSCASRRRLHRANRTRIHRQHELHREAGREESARSSRVRGENHLRHIVRRGPPDAGAE